MKSLPAIFLTACGGEQEAAGSTEPPQNGTEGAHAGYDPGEHAL